MWYADSDEDHLGGNDDRDLDHWEAIDMDDYQYRPLNQEAGRLFTSSERLLQNYARARALTVSDVKSLIEDVLRNPEVDPKEVDTNMMERLNRAIDDRDFEIIDVWKESDGRQEVNFYKRN